MRPWAFGIARHVHQMNRRAALRRRRHESRFPRLDWQNPYEIERIASADAVERFLLELPQERRECLVLHHALGLSFKEIGGIIGVRASTAKVRAFRALKQLKTIVAERESEESPHA